MPLHTHRPLLLFVILLLCFLFTLTALPSRADGEWSEWQKTTDPGISIRTKCRWYAESVHGWYWAYQIRNDYVVAKQIEWGAGGTYAECEKAGYPNRAKIPSGGSYTDSVTGPDDERIYIRVRVAKPWRSAEPKA